MLRTFALNSRRTHYLGILSTNFDETFSEVEYVTGNMAIIFWWSSGSRCGYGNFCIVAVSVRRSFKGIAALRWIEIAEIRHTSAAHFEERYV